MKQFLSIEQNDNVTKFTNESDYNIIASVIIKARYIRYRDFLTISAHSTHEDTDSLELDLLSFRFESTSQGE